MIHAPLFLRSSYSTKEIDIFTLYTFCIYKTPIIMRRTAGINRFPFLLYLYIPISTYLCITLYKTKKKWNPSCIPLLFVASWYWIFTLMHLIEVFFTVFPRFGANHDSKDRGLLLLMFSFLEGLKIAAVIPVEIK